MVWPDGSRTVNQLWMRPSSMSDGERPALVRRLCVASRSSTIRSNDASPGSMSSFAKSTRWVAARSSRTAISSDLKMGAHAERGHERFRRLQLVGLHFDMPGPDLGSLIVRCHDSPPLGVACALIATIVDQPIHALWRCGRSRQEAAGRAERSRGRLAWRVRAAVGLAEGGRACRLPRCPTARPTAPSRAASQARARGFSTSPVALPRAER